MDQKGDEMLRRLLLACGAIGAVLFVVVFLVDGAVHAGYDPIRDTVSELAIGPGGWVQIASFIATGLLMIAFATTLRRALHSTWAAILIGLYGTGLVASGIFVTDPVPSPTTTDHGTVHNLVSVVVFGGLAAACFVVARHRWTLLSRIVGVLVPVFFVLMGAVGGPAMGLLQRIAIVVGWAWVAFVSIRLVAEARRPVQRAVLADL
jgi:hypothetical membrane protein